MIGFALGCWIWVAVMALCQVGLLVVPVRVARGRPVTKRWIVWPILTSIFLTLLMFAAAFLAMWETIANSDEDTAAGVLWTVGGVVVAAWLVWVFLFGFYTGNRKPTTFMSRVAKFLIAGSILELLIAVPAHVLARTRGYCCAGLGTFWGLAVGLSVMLVVFGPATFVLFVRRLRSVKARKTPPPVH